MTGWYPLYWGYLYFGLSGTHFPPHSHCSPWGSLTSYNLLHLPDFISYSFTDLLCNGNPLRKTIKVETHPGPFGIVLSELMLYGVFSFYLLYVYIAHLVYNYFMTLWCQQVTLSIFSNKNIFLSYVLCFFGVTKPQCPSLPISFVDPFYEHVVGLTSTIGISFSCI